MPPNGFTTLTITEDALAGLRAFHRMLCAKGTSAIPKGVKRPTGEGLTMSESMEVLAALGELALKGGTRSRR